jgi:hypothetical protein
MYKLEILDKVKNILIHQDNLNSLIIEFNDNYFISIKLTKEGDVFELDAFKGRKVNIRTTRYYDRIFKTYKIRDNAIKTAIKFVDSNIDNDDTIHEVE